MGELKDLAKKQSKFLMLEVNESAEVVYVGYKIVPSPYDPTVDTVQYQFKMDGVDKFLTSKNTTLMRAFDEIPKGSKVKIYRMPMLDKAGKVVEGKSTYTVEKL